MNIPKINPERNYWFLRTAEESFYNRFIDQSIITIPWDELNDIDLIKSVSDNPLNTENKIIEEAEASLYELIKKTYPSEKEPENIILQIKYFANNIKEGDIIVILNENLLIVTFGVVAVSNLIIVPDNNTSNCCIGKKVHWLKTIKKDEIDPYLFKLFYSQHAINSADSYAAFIDRTLHTYFIKGDKAHLVLNITSTDHIYAKELFCLIYGLLDLIDDFNVLTGSYFDTNEIEIKINVQSPGPVELIAGAGIISAIGMLLHYVIGGYYEFKINHEEFSMKAHTEGLLEKILKFKQNASDIPSIMDKKEKVRSSINKLEVKIPEELDELEEMLFPSDKKQE